MSSGEGQARLQGKRVVLVLPGEKLGGAERGALELARDLRLREGAIAEMCALDDHEGPARRLADESGIPWRFSRSPWAGGRLRGTLALVALARFLQARRPDVLVSVTNQPNVATGLVWRAAGASVFLWNQCDVNGTRRIHRRLFRRALRGAPLVVTWAHHARAWLVDEWGADPRRVHVVHQKVELPAAREDGRAWRSRLGLRDDDFVACMIAHLHEGKDHATALRAWRRVVDELTNGRSRPVLLLAGRPSGTADALRALASDLELGEHVRFLGETDDPSGLVDAADLAVFCSHRECLPRGVTEPMAGGLAVAGSDIPGVREAVGPAGGRFLAPPGDASALADVILRLARDPALREAAGRANAELIRSRQSAAATTDVVARLLAEALANARA